MITIFLKLLVSQVEWKVCFGGVTNHDVRGNPITHIPVNSSVISQCRNKNNFHLHGEKKSLNLTSTIISMGAATFEPKKLSIGGQLHLLYYVKMTKEQSMSSKKKSNE